MNFEVSNFQVDVIDRSHEVPVLVDFWAEWCGPCKFLGPIIEKLAAESGGRWELVKVNTEVNQQLATEWGIRGIPNLKLFYHGEVIEEFSGAMAESEMKKWLEDKLPSKAKSLFLEAKRLFGEGKIELAESMMANVVEMDPDLTEAKLEYARMLLWKQPESAQDLVKHLTHIEEGAEIKLVTEAMTIPVDQLEDDVSKDELARGLRSLKENELDGFFKAFIQAIILNKYYRNGFARRMVIALFHLLGEGHEITKRYRRRFDMALY